MRGLLSILVLAILSAVNAVIVNDNETSISSFLQCLCAVDPAIRVDVSLNIIIAINHGANSSSNRNGIMNCMRAAFEDTRVASLTLAANETSSAVSACDATYGALRALGVTAEDWIEDEVSDASSESPYRELSPHLRAMKLHRGLGSTPADCPNKPLRSWAAYRYMVSSSVL